MLRSTSTVTLLSGSGARAPGAPSRRANVCRLRLTVPPESPASEPGEKKTERKEQQPDLSNGEPTRKLPQGVVYGVVRRSDPNEQKEMVVYGWSTSQLKEEMNYIRDVRATLEKVRKRMYGDYDEMRQKIRQLTQELSASQAQQEYLKNHIQTQSTALDSFNATNSALTSDSIGLQKTLVDVTLENSTIKDQMRDLRQTYEASMGQLREKQRQLEVARVENRLLKMKVESSQQANAEVMREMTKKLYSQYEEKLQEEQRKHSAEKEALLEETKSFLKAIEEANEKMEAAEISLEEKDRRIGELDRLIERMEKERHQLQLQLLEHETEMSGEIMDSDKERYQQLEEASTSLRERIRHLDDMVHCQQKKVKQMVEEIESLKKKVQQKQLLILQLLEKISFLEGENNELQSRLDYLTETQAKPEVETREIGVGCDLLPRQCIKLWKARRWMRPLSAEMSEWSRHVPVLGTQPHGTGAGHLGLISPSTWRPFHAVLLLPASPLQLLLLHFYAGKIQNQPLLTESVSPFCDLLPTLPPLPHVCQLCGLQWTGTLGSQASARTGLA